MRAYEIQESFGLDNLKLAERPDPVAGPGQVLVKMQACSVNYRDLLMIQGMYNPRQPLPLIPFSDGVGEVVAVGDGVTTVKTGDRVASCFVQGWMAGKPRTELAKMTLGGPLDGMLTEMAAFPEYGVLPYPRHLSDVEAATLPCAALTAWSALVVHGAVKAGDTVLIQGTGGVSIFALQFAKLLGARVVITSSSDEKLEKAKAMGADCLINYKSEPGWGKVAKKFTGGAGVDLVVEVGGAETIQQSIKAVRPGGTISMIGILSGVGQNLMLTDILMRQIRIQGILVGHRESYEDMFRAITQHKLKPVVDKAFAYEDARAALEYMGAGKHFGKVCIQVS